MTADDVVDPHQPGHPPAVGLAATGLEFGMDPRGAVGAVLLGVDLPDLSDRGGPTRGEGLRGGLGRF